MVCMSAVMTSSVVLDVVLAQDATESDSESDTERRFVQSYSPWRKITTGHTIPQLALRHIYLCHK
jgi:hypothetical protein